MPAAAPTTASPGPGSGSGGDSGDGERSAVMEAAAGEPRKSSDPAEGAVALGAGVRQHAQPAVAEAAQDPAVLADQAHRLVEVEPRP